jgi:peptidoglycan/LPS O-acetylase OafA/YrhL
LVNFVHTGGVTSGVQQTPRPEAWLGNVLDISASLIAVGLLALSHLGWSGLLRILLALAFTFFVPGRAIVTNWPRMERWSQVALPMVLSLALLALLATISLWAHVWKPMDLFEAEAVLSLIGLGLGIALRSRRRPDHSARESWSQSGDLDYD